MLDNLSIFLDCSSHLYLFSVFFTLKKIRSLLNDPMCAVIIPMFLLQFIALFTESALIFSHCLHYGDQFHNLTFQFVCFLCFPFSPDCIFFHPIIHAPIMSVFIPFLTVPAHSGYKAFIYHFCFLNLHSDTCSVCVWGGRSEREFVVMFL